MTGFNPMTHQPPLRFARRSIGVGICSRLCSGMVLGLCVLLALLCQLPVVFAAEVASGAANAQVGFETDLAAMTRHPHRLAGSEFGRQAGDYLLQRLESMGLQTLVLEFSAPQIQIKTCELQLGEQRVELLPCRPNMLVPPSTSAEGLAGPVIYAGQGRLEDYGVRDPQGAIVVLDYDSADHWQIAFSLGAKAVVFLQDDQNVPLERKFVPVPVNLPRFYVKPGQAIGSVLREDHAAATLVSHVVWTPSQGRNIIGYIPGTNPVIPGGNGKPEVLVLSANYDTYGEVPHWSPAARSAANVAALLQTAQFYQAQRPSRDVLIVFLDNQARYHQGARYFYDALTMKRDDAVKQENQHLAEQQFIQTMLQELKAGKISQAQSESVAVGSGVVTLWIGLPVALGVLVVIGFVLFAYQKHVVIGLVTTALVVVAAWMWIPSRSASSASVKASAEAATVSSVYRTLRTGLEKQAEFVRTDLNHRVADWRLQKTLWNKQASSEQKTQALKVLEEQIVQGQKRITDWDNIRRFLHEGKQPDAKKLSPELLEQLVGELSRAYQQRLAARLEELALQLRLDGQRKTIISRLADRWVCLHVTFNFSDLGPTWGVVPIDWTERVYFQDGPNTQGDTPGQYTNVLGAFRTASKAIAGDTGLSATSLADPVMAARHVSGNYVNGGMVAGTYGIYNVALMTHFDLRLRDGHPADTVGALNWRKIQQQAVAAQQLLLAAANAPGLSMPRLFPAQSLSKRPSWSDGRSSGDYVGLQMTGSLSEDRPASSSLLALAPSAVNLEKQDWTFARQSTGLPAFDPWLLEPVDDNGRFSLIGARKDLFEPVAGVGMLFNAQGLPSAVTTGDRIVASGVTAGVTGLMKFNIFPARSGILVYRRTQVPLAGTLSILSATTDALFQNHRSLFGQYEDISFVYTTSLLAPQPVKVFQERGPVILGMKEQGAGSATGTGISGQELGVPPVSNRHAASDLWLLNESRLQALRSRGVTDAALETLHGQAKRAIEQAERASAVVDRETWLTRSVSLSRAVYKPLRESMDDLVYAIVVLLLLAIPFAFAMERLAFAATTVYQRLAGFAAMFLVTFFLLFFMHPGFAIASTPIIIFLAFAILLLSGLVIYIISRKFSTELKAMQGQGAGVHQMDVSKLATMLAAVNMGMSTMRRRPTRTFLTAVTVVMLTFTILCFAAVTVQMGVRSVTQGPVNEEVKASLHIRHLNYKALLPELLVQLRGTQGEGGLVASQWWLARQTQNDDPYSVARTDDGRALWVDGMLGVSEQELVRWPQLAGILSGDSDSQVKAKLLHENGVFFPAIVQEKLGLRVGDTVLFHGRKVRFAGVIDAANFQRLTQLDGRPALPVDQVDANQAMADSKMDAKSSQVEDLVERDFVHLSPDQIAIASSELVQELGGTLRTINVYTTQSVDLLELGRQTAQMLTLPVWVRGPQGIERMIFTKLTTVAGGMAIVVPVILGGLIIFGTLLGSISDREKEIYTFSALGLAPKHVGFLFFAEAGVYAVVGGMVGQILAQVVALVAAQLASRGLIHAPSINYSSTNALFAIGLVMATVLISAVYPALRAGKSANPGLARSWKMPRPQGDRLELTFPFTVSAYDMTGIVSFLAEHFRAHNDAGLGSFAASDVRIGRDRASQYLVLSVKLALAPFDLGVTQQLSLTARPSEIPGVDEVGICADRASGAAGDWERANRVFMQDLRKQFLLWRTLSAQTIEEYRLKTLIDLGENAPSSPVQNSSSGPVTP